MVHTPREPDPEPDARIRDGEQAPGIALRPEEKVEVKLGCSFEVRGGTLGAVVGQLA